MTVPNARTLQRKKYPRTHKGLKETPDVRTTDALARALTRNAAAAACETKGSGEAPCRRGAIHI